MKNPEPNTLVATVRRIKALAQFTKTSVGPDAKGRLYFDHHAPGRDDATLYVDPESGMSVVYSWMESHHNGDHYDYREEMLSPEQGHIALTRILEQFEARALEHAKREVRQEQEAYYDELAKNRLANHMRKLL